VANPMVMILTIVLVEGGAFLYVASNINPTNSIANPEIGMSIVGGGGISLGIEKWIEKIIEKQNAKIGA